MFWTCYVCGAQTSTDPCWQCGREQACRACGTRLEGPFCTSCGVSAAAVPAAAQVAISEPPLALDEEGAGSDIRWAWNTLRAHPSGFLAVGGVALGVIAVAAVVAYLLSRVGDELEIGLLWWALKLLSLGTVFLGSAVATCFLHRSWARAARGSSPSLAAVVRTERLGSYVAAFTVVQPMTLLTPLVTGFVWIALQLSVGERLGPVQASTEMLSRSLATAAAFWRTVVIGVITSLYVVAWWVLVAFLVGSAGSAEFVEQWGSLGDSFNSSSNGVTFFVAMAVVVPIALALFFCLLNVVGLWVAAWTRRLTGRPIGSLAVPPPVPSPR